MTHRALSESLPFEIYDPRSKLLTMLLSADVSQTAKVCQVIRPARRLRSVSCQAARADGSGSAGETLPDEPPHSRQLANGQGFMLDEAAAAHDVVYGQNFGFVMTRPRRSTRGLVRCPGPVPVDRHSAQTPPGLALPASPLDTRII